MSHHCIGRSNWSTGFDPPEGGGGGKALLPAMQVKQRHAAKDISATETGLQ